MKVFFKAVEAFKMSISHNNTCFMSFILPSQVLFVDNVCSGIVNAKR